MNKALLWIIRIYQRYLSPYKGFRCAAGVYHDSDGCSTVVKTIIEERGVFRGSSLIRRQFRRCSAAARALQAESGNKKRRRRRRNGDAACCAAEAACWPFFL